jgi:hypothetical protein
MNNIKGRSIAALLAAFLLVQPGVATVSAMPTHASEVSTSSETPEEETLVTSLFASFKQAISCKDRPHLVWCK